MEPMNPDREQQASHAGRRWFGAASVLAVAVASAGCVGLIAWWVGGSSGDGPGGMVELAGPAGASTGRLVAFAFATMGLAWLAAPFTLGGRFDWPALFRWAVVIDTAGVGLFVGSIVNDAVGWREGLALYAILVAFAAMQLALLWLLSRAGVASGPAGGIAATVAVVACSTLLWGHLIVRPFRAGSPGDTAALAVVRYANPLLAANAAVNPPTRFDWPHHGQMYRRYGIIGEARAWPLPNWPTACGLYAGIAVLLVLAGLVWRRNRSAGGDREILRRS